MNEEMLSVLCGIAGAINNNGKLEGTDALILEAVSKLFTASEKEGEEIAERIRKEKFAISPNCQTCQNPCGNTSDYDMEKFHAGNPADKEIKQFMLYQLSDEAKRQLERLNSGMELQTNRVDLIYKGIAWFGYDLAAHNYEKIIAELNSLQ